MGAKGVLGIHVVLMATVGAAIWDVDMFLVTTCSRAAAQ
jgi:hypothetical protein